MAVVDVSALRMKRGGSTDGRVVAVFLSTNRMPSNAGALRECNASRVWAACKEAIPQEFRPRGNEVANGGLIHLARHFNHGFQCTAETRTAMMAYVQLLDRETDQEAPVTPLFEAMYAQCAKYRRPTDPAATRGYLGLFRDDAVPKKYALDEATGIERLLASASAVVLTYPGLMSERWDRDKVSRDVVAFWNSDMCVRKKAVYIAATNRPGASMQSLWAFIWERGGGVTLFFQHLGLPSVGTFGAPPHDAHPAICTLFSRLQTPLLPDCPSQDPSIMKRSRRWSRSFAPTIVATIGTTILLTCFWSRVTEVMKPWLYNLEIPPWQASSK